MTLADKKTQLLQQLSQVRNAQDRLAYLVRRARREPPFEGSLRTEQFKVEGCLSQLWLVPEFTEGKCFYRSDSDSMIVKGIAGLLCDLFSGHSPEEIISHDPAFLAEVGITQHLTPNRRNALSQVWEEIRRFALAHAGKGAMGKRTS
jgi:cysteine desulfuration protein SufE